jgi:hypothetical protein
MRRLIRRLRSYGSGEEGIAAVEFAIWLIVLVPILINVVDLAFYAYARVQVANAGQASAQAAWSIWNAKGCSYSTNTVANCGGNGTISTAITDAINQSSAIGGLSSAPITENTSNEVTGYFCPTSTGGLAMDGASPGVATCPSSYGVNTFSNSGAKAGYYYMIEVTYTYHPLFPAAAVTRIIGTTITHDTWIRLQ